MDAVPSRPTQPPPSPDLERATGLFSERQITVPLTIALLLTLALYLTLAHFLDPGHLPERLGRYLASGYCQSMLALFVATALYGVLQYLGLQDERHHLRRRFDPAAGSERSLTRDWIGFFCGRSHQDEDEAPAVLQRWQAQARSREDLVHLSDYVLTVRGQQHQHNFAPIGFAIWVLPLLGFIGTVLGITQAIRGLETSVAPSDTQGGGLAGVLGGLEFAFDTTFVGLVLVIPLMLALLILRARAQTLDMLYYQILLDRLFQHSDH